MLAVRGRSRSRSSVLAGAAVTVAISTLLLLLVAAPTCAFSATKARALVENLVHDEQCYLTDVRPNK